MADDRDFYTWSVFFAKDRGSLTKFVFNLKRKDFYFLGNGLQEDFDDNRNQLIYSSGFLEKDFQEVLANENPKNSYYKTRIAIALFYKVNLKKITERLGEENFLFVIERVLIDGCYEKYGIPYEKLIIIAIEKYGVKKEDLLDLSIMRGVNLGSRYRNKYDEIILKVEIVKNYFLSIFGI